MNEASRTVLASVAIGLVAAATFGRPFQAPPIERQLEDFVLAANEAWVVAARTLDDRGLRQWFSGEALEDQTNQLLLGQEHRARIEYEKPTIHFVQSQADENSEQASVVTEEGWAFRMADAETGKCLSQRDRNNTRVTYRLKRVAGEWSIYRIEQEYLSERPPSRPCAQ